MSFFLILFLSSSAFGQEPSLPYTDTNSVQAKRNLELMGAKNPRGMPESELGEWVRARFAWIALLRLEGKQKEAVKVFEACENFCAKHGSGAEWKALKAWGCDQKKTAAPCR